MKNTRFASFLVGLALLLWAAAALLPAAAASQAAPGEALLESASLETNPAWTSGGSETGGEYAYAVSLQGDYNQDGFNDLLLGAPKSTLTLDREGFAEAYYGSAGGLTTNPQWRFAGGKKAAFAGSAVACAGDVNGDGIDDAIIGAYRYQETEAIPTEGAAFVFYGSQQGLESAPAWTALGGVKESRFGYAVSSAGDVNGDGFDDVIVGAPWYLHAFENEGAAFVFHGSAAGLSDAPDWSSYGGQKSATYGTAVSGAGDVNGDGYDDVLVGAPGYHVDSEQTGAARLYFGSAEGLSLNAGWVEVSSLSDSRLGEAVSGAGDVNQDGYADLLIGMPGYSTATALSAGAVLIYLGSPDGPGEQADWEIWGTQEYEFLGNSVSPAGDIDGDGDDDVVYAAYSYSDDQPDEGIVFVSLSGSGGAQIEVRWSMTGDKSEAFFGFSVSGAGDVNGDGLIDLAVGAPYYRTQDTILGRAYLYLGCQACSPAIEKKIFLPVIK